MQVGCLHQQRQMGWRDPVAQPCGCIIQSITIKKGASTAMSMAPWLMKGESIGAWRLFALRRTVRHASTALLLMVFNHFANELREGFSLLCGQRVQHLLLGL